ncbi:prolyl-tRNA synthetase associated domain-containing protein [uncultured Sanguibacteroides sp.]|uniref:prolyl-tRNA synthetase associated domain-containing protein n=1 Tax=uncultured Sanguibacteroides sp. TaxID=1635151 RepID=UPI0025EB44D7|nr:prolyl-tRNA synthetase associated domain-containing protein [uncultured Sanguibacteroides sp.]
MVGQEKVYETLAALGITFDYVEHPAAPTIELARQYWKNLDSTHCKNLFFRNHKGDRHYLVIFDCDHDLAIHDLEKKLQQGKLSFASEKRMEKYLGLRPGSVSPFGLINDAEHHVHVFLDKNLQKAQKLSFHPNDNRASLAVKVGDFIRYMDQTGNGYEWIELY